MALLALLLGTIASAQSDERALQLLEGMQRADPFAGLTLEMLETVMVMVSHGAAESEIRMRTVIDYVGRRALIESDLGGGMRTSIRVVDGRVTMIVAGDEVALPPAMAALYDAIFDAASTAFDLADTEARYDGMRAYGNLVEGEQVTVRGAALLGFDALAPELGGEIEVAYLFDDAGRVLASVGTTAEGPMLMLLDDPEDPGSLAWASWRGYLLTHDGPELTMSVRYELVRVNEPIADGTF